MGLNPWIAGAALLAWWWWRPRRPPAKLGCPPLPATCPAREWEIRRIDGRCYLNVVCRGLPGTDEVIETVEIDACWCADVSEASAPAPWW